MKKYNISWESANKMRIMFVIDSMYKGGAERVISNLANAMCNDNDVAITTINNLCSNYVLDDKIKRYCLTILDEKKHLFKLINIINKIKNLVKYKRNFKPDIVIAFLPKSCFYTVISNFFCKSKIILSERNNPEITYKKISYKILMKLLYPKSNGFVFQTEDAKNFFSKKIQQKCTVIPNPINEEFMIKEYNGKRKKVIVNVGRLDKQKNQELLIRAFTVFASKYPEYRLNIYGEGELRDYLQNVILQCQMENKIHLFGNVNDIKDKIIDAKMFVLSSLYEGMPNALMEAMALGIPSISTDCPCGGPKYLIRNSINGILIQNDNIDELLAAMELLANDEILANKISHEAHKITTILNPKEINQKWIGYIKKVFEEER